MFRRLRNVILIVVAAAAGAAIGRWLAEARARVDEGGDPLSVDLHDVSVRPQDIVPGVVAAFRVGEPPWSWLHIPAWLAAFGTNFAAAAVGGDLDRLRQMAEDRALGALGLQPQDLDGDAPPPDSPWATQAEDAGPAAPPEPTQPVWTAENTSPPAANGNGSTGNTPGFTPLRD